MTIYTGISQEETKVYYTTIILGLEDASVKYAHLGNAAAKIATIRNIKWGGSDPSSRKIPKEVFFPFSNRIRAQDITGKGERSFEPLIRVSARLPVRVFGAGYSIHRHDFYNDVYGTLAGVPRNLTIAAISILPQLLARTLRAGTVGTDSTGTPFFSTAKFGATGNLSHHSPLSTNAVKTGLKAIASRCGDDGECLGLKGDTLIVPSSLLSEANDIAKQIEEIKQVVELPELIHKDDPTSATTWYLASCQGDRGALALLGAIEDGFEFLTNLSPSEPPSLMNLMNRFAWAIERFATVGYGDAAFITRFEAGAPSQPIQDDLLPVGIDVENSMRAKCEAAEVKAAEAAAKADASAAKKEPVADKEPSLDDLITTISKHTNISFERIKERVTVCKN